MRELMNIVFYISVSFFCSFTKISISEANSQYSQPNSLSLWWDQNIKKPRGAAGVNRTQFSSTKFSSTNTLEGIILSLLNSTVSSLHPKPRCKTGIMKIQILNLVILGREGKHLLLILFQTMSYLLSNCLERSWIWDLKKYGEYISKTCMSYKLWISRHIELKMNIWPFV